jgi:hypothetical protein
LVHADGLNWVRVEKVIGTLGARAMHKPRPSWLNLRGGPNKSRNPTSEIILRVFQEAATYGVHDLWPAQVNAGAVECFGYDRSKHHLCTRMRVMVKEGVLVRGEFGFRLANASATADSPAGASTP